MTITFLASPYHTSGRQGAKITDIVLHWMVGTLASTDREFVGGSRRVSAHYGIENGAVHQYVHDGDTAWHAGDHAENIRSIGIEHSGGDVMASGARRPVSPATIATSVALIVALCRKYSISPDHIYPHNKFFPTACPGTLPIAAIIAAVRAQLAPPPAPIQQEDVMKPWFIRAKSGAIVIVGPTGVRPLTPSQWQTWRNLGYGLAPGMGAMDPGPFQAVIDSLGGLIPAGK